MITAWARAHLLCLLSLLLFAKAIDFWLDRYELLYSQRGAVFGATYTDVHATLPALQWLAVLTALCAITALIHVFRRSARPVLAGLAVVIVGWMVGVWGFPTLVQRLRVAPNALVAESPYIAHHIRMTRRAFALDRIQERDFPARETLTAADLARNAPTLKNVRLWDHAPLLATFAQLQEIRTYYRFVDVDNDRYAIDGEYQQVMLSARELSYQNLPRDVQGRDADRQWINEHLQYTHGYGSVVGPVNRITAEGLPELYVKDIPPVSRTSLRITRPEIYFGEVSNEYVFVRTRSQEIDYPAGDENVYTTYAGRGGVPVGSFWRRLLLSIRFGSYRILLSPEITSESRVLFHRQIGERVRRIAPFLRLDADPYFVIREDGRLAWILDGYTVTDRFPYAERVAGLGNYVRNSVKVVVDAYEGSVSLYVSDPEDPIVRAFAAAFPGLLAPIDTMPADLRSHVRYPAGFFAVQARMYATYHMQDPRVFYNKEDLWSIPRTPEGGGREREQDPYYTIMRIPGEPREEFVLLMPFTPLRRDNMIAWLAARSDGPGYGRLAAFLFPKQRLVYRTPADRRPHRPGRRHLPADHPLEPAGLNGPPREPPGNPGGGVAHLRPAPVPGGREGLDPGAQARDRRLRQPDRDGRDVRRLAPGALRPPARRGGGARSGALGRRGSPATPAGAWSSRAWEAWTRAQEALRRGDWGAYGEAQRRLEDALKALRDRPAR